MPLERRQANSSAIASRSGDAGEEENSDEH
jgi:hypothetical protein